VKRAYFAHLDLFSHTLAEHGEAHVI
jgi:hypothetical protein